METPIFDEMYPSGVVYTAKMAGRVAALKAEHEALRQRASDLELFARSLCHDFERDWFYFDKEKEWALYDRAYDSPSANVLARCKDDGTGLPLLTPEARSALLRAVKGG